MTPAPTPTEVVHTRLGPQPPRNRPRRTIPNPVTDAFRDTTGRWRTTSLFIEWREEPFPAFFTLSEEDDPETGAVSLHKKYLEYNDPTEYTFAHKMFGSWAGWKRMCDSPKLRPYIERWREELRARIESETISELRRISQDSAHPNQLTALKAVLDYTTKKTRTKKMESVSDEKRSTETKVQEEEWAKTLPVNPTIPPWADKDWDRVFKEPYKKYPGPYCVGGTQDTRILTNNATTEI